MLHLLAFTKKINMPSTIWRLAVTAWVRRAARGSACWGLVWRLLAGRRLVTGAIGRRQT